MEYNSDFRYDLKIGQEYETLLSEVIESTIEVKRDFKCYDTGNLFVEYESRGKKSGISTTQAKWWVYWFSKTRSILIETSELKQMCRKYVKRLYCHDYPKSAKFLQKNFFRALI